MSFCTPELNVFFLKCTFLFLDSRKSIDTSLYTSWFLGWLRKLKCCRVDFKYSKAKKSSEQRKNDADKNMMLLIPAERTRMHTLLNNGTCSFCRTESLLDTSLRNFSANERVVFKLFQEQLPFPWTVWRSSEKEELR